MLTTKIAMKSCSLFLVGAILIWFALSPTANAQSKFDNAQKEAIGEIIHEYLLENPELVAEAMDKYYVERDAKIEAEAMAALRANWDELLSDPFSYVAGNPEGDVTVIEFFDYNCSYCRLAMPTILKALKKDSNIRLVLKEFPIRGRDSEKVARMALASLSQEKYFDYHIALMEVEGQMTEDRAKDIAKDLRLNVKQLRKDMDDPEFDKIIARNDELAELLFVDGTPSFIIGEQIIRGWPGEEKFLSFIAEARGEELD